MIDLGKYWRTFIAQKKGYAIKCIELMKGNYRRINICNRRLNMKMSIKKLHEIEPAAMAMLFFLFDMIFIRTVSLEIRT